METLEKIIDQHDMESFIGIALNDIGSLLIAILTLIGDKLGRLKAMMPVVPMHS